MAELTDRSEATTPGAASVANRLKSLATRPQSLALREVIERYMARYSGRDASRGQRLAAWLSMAGDFTLEQCDSDLMHAARAELATKPALVYMGLDHRGEKIFNVKSRRKPKDPATLNRYSVAISAVFTWAIEERLTPKVWVHPCRGIKRLREADGRVRFLSADERTRLFAAVRESEYPRLYALTLMAMKTGARRGELLGLTWRDVDLDAGLATLCATKNGDRRTLVLLPDVVEALRPCQSSDLGRYVFGSVKAKYTKPTSIDSAWRDAVARAEVENFKFHDLRHCFASYMAQSGVALHVIADALGHRKLDMTRRYAHLITQTKASAMRSALGDIQ